ncbi:MAG: sterol desaturase family protein, partial [Cyclobacteriaceae bacterium]|nr:sterol desaturase family protein [Cyclobacteriaceae bacterium]
ENLEQYLKFKKGEIRMPAHLKPQKELSGKLYESAFMERITRTPIWVPQVLWLTISAVFFWIAFTKTEILTYQILILGIAGFVTWTLTEYIVHRFLYHTESNSNVLYDIQYKGHGFHHLYPKDPERLAMPPVPGLVLSLIFLGLFYLIMDSYALAFFPGFMLGYNCYITMHYFQHVVKSPMYKPWQKLWTHHKAHHYSNPYAAFGVSTRLWDYVFGTMPQKSKKAKPTN